MSVTFTLKLLFWIYRIFLLSDTSKLRQPDNFESHISLSFMNIQVFLLILLAENLLMNLSPDSFWSISAKVLLLIRKTELFTWRTDVLLYMTFPCRTLEVVTYNFYLCTSFSVWFPFSLLIAILFFFSQLTTR